MSGTGNGSEQNGQGAVTTVAEGTVMAERRFATPAIQLAVATTGFLLTFWAWALISPLGARYTEQLAGSRSGR